MSSPVPLYLLASMLLLCASVYLFYRFFGWLFDKFEDLASDLQSLEKEGDDIDEYIA